MKRSYHPSGRYRRTIRGIFFWLSSLIAICSGSVSPSKSTRMGAFWLFSINCRSRFNGDAFISLPDLQGPRSQNSCALILCHIRCRRSLVIGDLFVGITGRLLDILIRIGSHYTPLFAILYKRPRLDGLLVYLSVWSKFFNVLFGFVKGVIGLVLAVATNTAKQTR